MHRPKFFIVPQLKLEELEAYHADVVAALRLYFSPAGFAKQSSVEIEDKLQSRILESEARSILAILSSLEAHFRTDFNVRCRMRLKDDLSAYFRKIERARGDRVRLDEDILAGWKKHANASDKLIGELRGALKVRHWLAHGRCWAPKLGQKYHFEDTYLLASAVVSTFPFEI